MCIHDNGDIVRLREGVARSFQHSSSSRLLGLDVNACVAYFGESERIQSLSDTRCETASSAHMSCTC